MRVVIVDDEEPARTRLQRLLLAQPGLEVIGHAANGLEALELIDRVKPEVVFLDIEMPELDGLGVAEALGGSGPSIVFVTAYDEHALRAFELAAVDYIVKPVAEARLIKVIQRLQIHVPRDHRKLFQEMPAHRLAVRLGSKYVVIDPGQVSAVLARDHYAAIIADGREFLAEDSLENVANRFRPGQFVRVHRNALVNLDFLKELEREGDRKYTAVLNDPANTRVAVSRERLAELKVRLGIDSHSTE